MRWVTFFIVCKLGSQLALVFFCITQQPTDNFIISQVESQLQWGQRTGKSIGLALFLERNLLFFFVLRCTTGQFPSTSPGGAYI